MKITKIIAEPQHHAYIVFGYTPEELCANRCEGLFLIQTDTGIGVDEIRELHGYAFQATGTGNRKIILSTPSISFQAQNALLKMMEETEQGTYFFLCVPQGTEILGTLLSRCYLIDKNTSYTENLSEHFKAFVGTKAKERLVVIDKIWDQSESVRHSAVLRLLQDLENYIHQNFTAGTKEKDIDISQHRKAAQNLRNAIYKGALHKATLQVLAFI